MSLSLLASGAVGPLSENWRTFRLGGQGSTPEDAGGVAVDLVEHLLDITGRPEPVVGVEAQVAVAC